MTTASINSTTITVSWPCGGDIDDGRPCIWREMHHFDDDGKHWCPTGFMFCHTHAAVGFVTGPGTCQLWDEYHEDGPFQGG